VNKHLQKYILSISSRSPSAISSQLKLNGIHKTQKAQSENTHATNNKPVTYTLQQDCRVCKTKLLIKRNHI